MIVLGIDTSTWWASVGVAADGQVRGALIERAESSHATGLLGLVERTLDVAGVALRQVQGIAVTGGPGSFTGLRVGLSTAKGLAYAIDARLVTVPTLETFAHTVDDFDGPVAPLLDARKGELYAGLFAVSPTAGCRRLAPDRLASFADVVAGLPERCLVIGDAEESYAAELRERVGADVVVRPAGSWRPTGSAAAVLGTALLESGAADAGSSAEPCYIRLSEAELNAVST